MNDHYHRYIGGFTFSRSPQMELYRKIISILHQRVEKKAAIPIISDAFFSTLYNLRNSRNRKGDRNRDGQKNTKREVVQALHEIYNAFDPIVKMIPKITDRYSVYYHSRFQEEFVPYVEFIRKCLRSTFYYNRYKLSPLEWAVVIKYADETSARVASKKYHLSASSIEKKSKEMKKYFDEDFKKFICCGYNIFRVTIDYDPKLLEEYNKIRKQQPPLLQQEVTEYTYTCYKAIHYDPDLYQMQKKDKTEGLRQSDPDGRRECRLEKSDIEKLGIPLYIESK